VNIQTFNDANGKTSLMRCLVAYVVVVFTTTWVILSIKDGALYEIDYQQAAIVIGALLAKSQQKN